MNTGKKRLHGAAGAMMSGAISAAEPLIPSAATGSPSTITSTKAHSIAQNFFIGMVSFWLIYDISIAN